MTRCLGLAGSCHRNLDDVDGTGARAGQTARAHGQVDFQKTAVARRQHVGHALFRAVGYWMVMGRRSMYDR